MLKASSWFYFTQNSILFRSRSVFEKMVFFQVFERFTRVRVFWKTTFKNPNFFESVSIEFGMWFYLQISSFSFLEWNLTELEAHNLKDSGENPFYFSVFLFFLSEEKTFSKKALHTFVAYELRYPMAREWRLHL